MKEELKFKLNLQNFADPEEKKDPQPDEEESGLAAIVKKQKDELAKMKKDFAELKKENTELTDMILNNEVPPSGEDDEEEEEEKIDLDACRKKLFTPNSQLSNLEYVKTALLLRKGVLAETGKDIFAPQPGASNAGSFTDLDNEKAKKVAEAFQYCVDESGGDPGVFTAKLQSITEQDNMLLAALQQLRRKQGL